MSSEKKEVKRDRPWLMRTYSGHSSARASNELYRTNLSKGQTGLSVAFDLPTQTGYDPDHRDAGPALHDDTARRPDHDDRFEELRQTGYAFVDLVLDYFKGIGNGALVFFEMVAFVVILFLGLVYAIRKGVLRWE